mmetsp:Transcript_28068/g.67061  ORF Transcript_28068/g.67061 Transcript_28068/m.67061 type:complete len:243 (+) Transcript_28068:245-973(+)
MGRAGRAASAQRAHRRRLAGRGDRVQGETCSAAGAITKLGKRAESGRLLARHRRQRRGHEDHPRQRPRDRAPLPGRAGGTHQGRGGACCFSPTLSRAAASPHPCGGAQQCRAGSDNDAGRAHVRLPPRRQAEDPRAPPAQAAASAARRRGALRLRVLKRPQARRGGGRRACPIRPPGRGVRRRGCSGGDGGPERLQEDPAGKHVPGDLPHRHRVVPARYARAGRAGVHGCVSWAAVRGDDAA